MKREDTAAAIYAALSAGLLLACLSAALFLPVSSVWNRWTGWAALAGFVAGMPLLLRAAHRSRIDQAVHEKGGVLIGLRKRPFWHNSLRYWFFLGEKFDVEYVDLLGRTHHGLCNSGFFQGVEWVEDRVTGRPSE